MNEREYREANGISRSELWKIKASPEKFKYSQEHPEEPTPALVFGQMVHKLILEPESFDDEFVLMPEVDRRTKEGKQLWSEFITAAGDKTPVKGADYEQALAMKNALMSVDVVGKLLSGAHEVPLFWTDAATGEVCKVRLDAIMQMDSQTLIVDYKTTADASTESFMKSAINYGYDFQAAMYSEAVRCTIGDDKPIKFIFIAQEKDAPYAVNIMVSDERFVMHGYDTFRELLGIYHECKVTGNWWGYMGEANQINVLDLPAWLKEEDK